MVMVARLLLVLLAWATVAVFATTAEAAACGGAVPCSCGDDVVADRTLTTDPVTTTVCPGDGLAVLPGVTLDLGGKTIRGAGGPATVGLRLSSGVTVGNGEVTRFGTGVLGFVEVNDTTIHDLRVTGSTGPGFLTAGIFVDGDRTVVEDCIVRGGAGDAIVLLGTANEIRNGNVVRGCRVEDNAGDGIEVGFNQNVVTTNIVRRNGGTGVIASGGGNRVTLNRVEQNTGDGIRAVAADPDPFGVTVVARNLAFRNGEDGVDIGGTQALVDRNQAKYNGLEGFNIGGSRHTVVRNIALGNGTDGFTVDCEGCIFRSNRSSYNGGHGILDTSSGAGTGGTANTYDGDVCTGNEQGDSSPAELCD